MNFRRYAALGALWAIPVAGMQVASGVGADPSASASSRAAASNAPPPPIVPYAWAGPYAWRLPNGYVWPADLEGCRSWQQVEAFSPQYKVNWPPLTHFRITPVRWTELVTAARGLRSTNIAGDDPGLSLAVPWLAQELHLRLNFAYDLFSAALLTIGFAASALGFLALTPALKPRLVAIAAIAGVVLLAAHIGDVYVILGMLPLAFVFWVILAPRRRSLLLFIVVGAAVGLASPLANLVRSHSGTCLLLFVVVIWGLAHGTPTAPRLVGLGTVALCFMLSWAFCTKVLAVRDLLFLRNHITKATVINQKHVFWHSVYIGLGYVSNGVVPIYGDEIAVAKVCTIDPNADFASPAYERVLRTATLDLIRTQPGLIGRNLLRKSMRVLLYLLLFGSVGWVSLLFRSLVWPVDTAFFAAMAINSAVGLLVIPSQQYLFGLITYAVLFSAMSFLLAFERSTNTLDVSYVMVKITKPVGRGVEGPWKLFATNAPRGPSK